MNNPDKISVIMPVFLGPYAGGATAREYKFIRAVFSFIDNDYENKELIICSDGCAASEEIFLRHKHEFPNVYFYKIDKQPLFSGNVREHALTKSNGNIITYLDSDDELGSTHLSTIMHGFKKSNYEFVYWDDYVRVDPRTLKKRNTQLQFSMVGTSCIAHKKTFRNKFSPSWIGCNGYGHDWQFISKILDNTKRQAKIYKCDYQVCHVPHLGFDN